MCDSLYNMELLVYGQSEINCLLFETEKMKTKTEFDVRNNPVHGYLLISESQRVYSNL